MTYRLIQTEIEAYGAGILAAPYVAITWAARNVAAKHGAEIARKQLRALNKRREAMGAAWVYEIDCGL